MAKDAGFEVVYQARASLAQPDFTAECLGARNARADLLFIQLDPNSIGRFAASCARQDYRPNYTAIPPAISAQASEDPNLSTMIGATNVFPFFQTGTPALDEFRQAVKAFARDGVRGWPTAAGWVSGKLFERAAADLPEPPTTDALLRRLWSFKNDDLGGLTVPLSFTEGAPAAPVMCWWNIAIHDGAWASPDGFKRHCRPVPAL